jgi:hypothetical protein
MRIRYRLQNMRDEAELQRIDRHALAGDRRTPRDGPNKATARRLARSVKDDHAQDGFYGAITKTSNEPGRGAARPPPAGTGPGRDATV